MSNACRAGHNRTLAGCSHRYSRRGYYIYYPFIFKFRESLVNSIPKNLKLGITTGIGLFIAIVGLKGAGIVADDASNLVGMGKMSTPQVVLALVGFLIIAILTHYKVKGAILIGIIVTWLLGIGAQLTGWYDVTVNPSLIPNFSVENILQAHNLRDE